MCAQGNILQDALQGGHCKQRYCSMDAFIGSCLAALAWGIPPYKMISGSSGPTHKPASTEVIPVFRKYLHLGAQEA